MLWVAPRAGRASYSTLQLCTHERATWQSWQRDPAVAIWMQQPLEKSPRSPERRSLSEPELNLICKLLPVLTRVSAPRWHKEKGDNLMLADMALRKRRP